MLHTRNNSPPRIIGHRWHRNVAPVAGRIARRASAGAAHVHVVALDRAGHLGRVLLLLVMVVVLLLLLLQVVVKLRVVASRWCRTAPSDRLRYWKRQRVITVPQLGEGVSEFSNGFDLFVLNFETQFWNILPDFGGPDCCWCWFWLLLMLWLL